MRGLPLRVGALLLFSACPGPAATPPAAGQSCPKEESPGCDPVTVQLLRCAGGAWTVYSDCKGPRGCYAEGDALTCDTSGNSVGDRCAPPSEGKVRCDPDGGTRILQCSDGGLALVFSCPAQTVCGLFDGGLTCR